MTKNELIKQTAMLFIQFKHDVDVHSLLTDLNNLVDKYNPETVYDELVFECAKMDKIEVNRWKP